MAESIDFKTDRPAPGEMVVHLFGRMDVETTASAHRYISRLVKKESPDAVTIDLAALSYIDDFGANLLLSLDSMISGVRFDRANANESVKAVLDQVESDALDAACRKTKQSGPGAIVRLGDASIKSVTSALYMICFLGSVILSLLKVIAKPKRLRFEDTLIYMEKTGVDALPIVALISFLLGLIMAFMSSMQLRQFGANIYVASLVAFAMVSELGPIMTAIVVAGRSGSAYAAEIGTMRISEEIDALFVMGFDPTLFLAVPRIIAALLVVPFLTLFSDFCAILGGLVIGVTMLDLSMSTYISQTLETLTIFEMSWGAFKSGVFAIIIAWTGCLRGFQSKGGASAVGNAATSAVVTSIFLIIVFDSLFAVMRSYM